MDKKSLAILLVAIDLYSFASSAFATSIIDKLITKHSSDTPFIVKTYKTTNQNNRPYTDFSGTWIVDCGRNPTTMVIENNAHYISFNGISFRIGQGLQGDSSSNERFIFSGHTSFEWNADGSALIQKSVESFKDNTDNSPIHTQMDIFTLTMKNSQINLDGKYVMFDDVTLYTQGADHCIFSKKQ